MRKRSAVAGGLALSMALLLRNVDRSVAKTVKASCTKKKLGAVVGVKVCTHQNGRYLWVTVAPTPPSAAPAVSVPVDPVNPTSAVSTPGTQRMSGFGGAWAVDVPASWTVKTPTGPTGQQTWVSATNPLTGAELWMASFPLGVKLEKLVADNPAIMKRQYGVNLVKSEPGTFAGSAIHTQWYSEPGSTKRILVRQYACELSVGGFLIAEITTKSDETEAMLLSALDRMDVRWSPAT
jgi:hypothetical protein